jgi:hypothetical protein
MLRISFYIKFGINDCFRSRGILITDVTLIRPWVYGDSLNQIFGSVATFNGLGTFLHGHYVSGYFVDVYT